MRQSLAREVPERPKPHTGKLFMQGQALLDPKSKTVVSRRPSVIGQS